MKVGLDKSMILDSEEHLLANKILGKKVPVTKFASELRIITIFKDSVAHSTLTFMKCRMKGTLYVSESEP